MAYAKKNIRFERVNNVLFLSVGNDSLVSFKEEWLKYLANIPNIDYAQLAA